jgi:hypothetical protein
LTRAGKRGCNYFMYNSPLGQWYMVCFPGEHIGKREGKLAKDKYSLCATLPEGTAASELANQRVSE